jgi:hypothetical protein
MATSTMTGGRVAHVGPLRIAITVLIAATALAHLYVGISTAMSAAPQAAPAAVSILATLFILNFGGYTVLGIAYNLPALRRFQGLTRVLLILYTALTILAYFAVNQTNSIDVLGLSDKAVEIALIALLVIEGRRKMSQR